MKVLGKKSFRIGAAVSLLAASIAGAQQPKDGNTRRPTADAIFTEPRGSIGPQLLYTLGDIVAFQLVRPKLPESKALTDADQRILAAVNAADPEDVKLRNIHDAERELAEARLLALNSLEERRIVPRLIRSARVVGSTLILVDLAGRAWVWGALNANPTWSPAVTALGRVASGLSTDNALPGR